MTIDKWNSAFHSLFQSQGFLTENLAQSFVDHAEMWLNSDVSTLPSGGMADGKFRADFKVGEIPGDIEFTYPDSK
jgi:hypothetical protein